MSARQIDWNSGDGLIPAIVQDASNGAVLELRGRLESGASE